MKFRTPPEIEFYKDKNSLTRKVIVFYPGLNFGKSVLYNNSYGSVRWNKEKLNSGDYRGIVKLTKEQAIEIVPDLMNCVKEIRKFR
jgi:hypothetical protein